MLGIAFGCKPISRLNVCVPRWCFRQALDPSITVEGLAFDSFGLSEEMARQAASTVA